MPFMTEDEDGKIKPANYPQEYTAKQMIEYTKCAKDPIYFIRTYVKIQHPKLGSIPFELFDYQEKLINVYHKNPKVVAMLSRQSGKCVTSLTRITKCKNRVAIGGLISLSFRERIITWLDNTKVWLARYVTRKSSADSGN